MRSTIVQLGETRLDLTLGELVQQSGGRYVFAESELMALRAHLDGEPLPSSLRAVLSEAGIDGLDGVELTYEWNSGPWVRLGGCILDYEQGQLLWQAERTQLQPAGRSLLRCLVEAGKAGLGHDEIRDRVWGEGASGGEVRKLVNSVRRQLERASGRTELIRTRPGHGYTLQLERPADTTEELVVLAVDTDPGDVLAAVLSEFSGQGIVGTRDESGVIVLTPQPAVGLDIAMALHARWPKASIALAAGRVTRADHTAWGAPVAQARALAAAAGPGSVVGLAEFTTLREEATGTTLGCFLVAGQRLEVFGFTSGGAVRLLQSDVQVAPELFGREELFGEVVESLETTPIVSLLGPGGIGKTTLAKAIGRQYVDHVFGGVALCGLETATTRAEALQAIAFGLGVSNIRGSLLDVVDASLRNRGRELVILDNAEPVIREVGELLDRWLGLAPEVRFLVTSRQPVDLPAERGIEMAPLGQGAAEAMLRSRAALERVELSDEQATSLVSHAAGVPLAIELLAAMMGSVSVDDLVSQGRALLAQRKGGGRLGSIGACVQWSLDLCSDDQRQALERLAVVPGEVELELAESLVGRGAAEALRSLQSKSLVALDQRGESPVVKLHPFVREVLLAAVSETERRKVTERWIGWWVRLIEEQWLGCLELIPRQLVWTQRLESLVHVAAAARSLGLSRELGCVSNVVARLGVTTRRFDVAEAHLADLSGHAAVVAQAVLVEPQQGATRALAILAEGRALLARPPERMDALLREVNWRRLHGFDHEDGLGEERYRDAMARAEAMLPSLKPRVAAMAHTWLMNIDVGRPPGARADLAMTVARWQAVIRSFEGLDCDIALGRAWAGLAHFYQSYGDDTTAALKLHQQVRSLAPEDWFWLPHANAHAVTQRTLSLWAEAEQTFRQAIAAAARTGDARLFLDLQVRLAAHLAQDSGRHAESRAILVDVETRLEGASFSLSGVHLVRFICAVTAGSPEDGMLHREVYLEAEPSRKAALENHLAMFWLLLRAHHLEQAQQVAAELGALVAADDVPAAWRRDYEEHLARLNKALAQSESVQPHTPADPI